MMHNCNPPMEALNRWLLGAVRGNNNYGHILFEQQTAADEALVAALRPYFESAHLDARDVFHHAARIDLHPDADGPGGNARYPNCLPPTARKGLFGEVMAGMLVQAYQFVGRHHWSIPIFLFRYHAEVEAYIFVLARDPARVREVSGRHGNDFIGLGIDPASREVVRFIAGEAKWRASLTPAVMDELMLGEWDGPAAAGVRTGDGIWNEMNTGLAAPQGLEQINKLLCEKAREEYAEAIVSLDRALLLGAAPLARTDYIFIAGNKAARRAAGQAYLPTNAPPPEYTAGRPLQIVELVISNGVALIDSLYDSLWNPE
ncbi:aminotransferase [Rhizobium leguminosarum]|uniref:aminotransferase n=1 Tax=Rhizobium leguminosarum TaxID=384 RepID=UPI0013CA4613|nr:aminotransferase [Rhizobium leguminosarum]NEI93937.1 aminotransferase [Rhizobium leguminosarum]